MNGPAVVSLLQEYRGVSAWRCMWPLEELGRRGYQAAWGDNADPQHSARIEQADVVVLHRPAWLPGDELKAVAWRDLLHARGKVLVIDYDDDLLSVEILERIRITGDEELNKRSDARLELERQTRIFALRLADGVTVSTPHLANVCRQYTDKPVIVVPNAIDLPRFRAGLEGYTRRLASPTIGWAGGNRPDRDAEQLAIAWGRLAEQFPDVTFVVAGYPLPALINAVPMRRLVYLPMLPLPIYACNYAEIDIACCPLADEPFNRAKSPIKAMEFAASGAAVVASPTVYGDFITDGEDGLIAATADEWERQITRLVKFRGRREALAMMLRNKVERDHTLAANVGSWPKAWAAILAQFDAARDAEVVAFA